MRVLSAKRQDELFRLATLEYAVHRRVISRQAALTEAREQGISSHLLDGLTRRPGKGAMTVVGNVAVRTVSKTPKRPARSPTNDLLRTLPFSAELQRPTMSQAEAQALCDLATQRLGFPFVLDWATDSQRIEVDVKRATHVRVPGGLARAPGMTPDALALIMAHERGHRVLRSKNEARADYWSARYGARKLWPDLPPEELRRKCFLAAYAVLAYVGGTETEPLQLLTGDKPTVVMKMSGYPTLQSRWELFKAGILERPMPPVVQA